MEAINEEIDSDQPFEGKIFLVSVCLWGWCSVWDFGYDTGKRKKKDFLLNLAKH